MSDVVEAKALIKVSADTRHAVKGINDLASAQKGLGEETKKTQASFKDMVNAVSDGFAKFNLAAGGVSKAFEVVGKGLDAALTESRLKAMEKLLPAGAVDRLRGAVDGLIPRTALLGVAVKSMTGDFALTEKQMGTVLRAAIALEQKGYGPAVQIAEKLNDALVNGVNRLDDFGIDLEKTDDRLGDVNRAMASFDQIIRDTPVDERTASLKRLQTGLQDIADAMNQVVAAAANAVAFLMEAGGDLGMRLGSMHERSLADGPAPYTVQERNARVRADRARRAAEAQMYFVPGEGDYAESLGVPGYDERPIFDAIPFNNQGRPKRRGGGDSGYERKSNAGFFEGDERDAWDGPEMGWSGIDARNPMNDNEAQSGFVDQFSGMTAELQSMAQAGDPVVQMMRDLGDSATFAGAGFGVFQDAFGAAVGAAIDGSKGIGQAFLEASAAGLKGLAVEYAVRAIGEGAWALTSLAYGDGKGAAAHGLAAAKFAAAAAAAGIGAAALGSMVGGSGGGGGGGAGAAAGGNAGNYSTGAGGVQENASVNIYFGDGFIGSPQQVEDAIARGIRRANQRGQRSDYPTKFSGG